MDGLNIDTSDLKLLAADIDRAAGLAPATVRAVVQKGALNIKTDAQARIGRGPYLPSYAQSISYDTTLTPTGASAEIGPDKGKRQGALGNILEYGSPSRPPHPHLGPALDAEEPKFAAALEAVIGGVLGW